MRATIVVALALLCGCGSNTPSSPPGPTAMPLAAPVWEATVQVADAGRGYFVGRFFNSGGPWRVVVDAAGNAYAAVSYFDTTTGPLREVWEAWGNAYRTGQGWGAAVRLSAGTGLLRDAPIGIGLTPDGALFGWAGNQTGGLRGFDMRAGWLPVGTVLTAANSTRVVSMATDARGTPALTYVENERCWLVRHTGVLEPPEGPLDACGQLASDGVGALAAIDEAVAVRLPDGRWRMSPLPSTPGTFVRVRALVGRPGGGFVAGWAEDDQTQLAYAVAVIDAAGNIGPRRHLATVPRPDQDPLFGQQYDPQIRLAASAAGAVAAWRVQSALYVSREIGAAWEPVQAVPNAAVVGGAPSQGAKLPFDLALDGNGTLLIAWVASSGLTAVQRAPGGDWSPTGLVAAVGQGPQLGMNAAGTAFMVWCGEGTKVMAARSSRR